MTDSQVDLKYEREKVRHVKQDIMKLMKAHLSGKDEDIKPSGKRAESQQMSQEAAKQKQLSSLQKQQSHLRWNSLSGKTDKTSSTARTARFE